MAASLGYVMVGEMIDPQDWNLWSALPDGTTAAAPRKDIAQTVLDQLGTPNGELSSCCTTPAATAPRRCSAHPDARAASCAQRLRVRPRLRPHRLAPASRSMPTLTKASTLMIGHRWLRVRGHLLFEPFLGAAFISGIGLGTARVAFVTILALWADRAKRARRFDDTFQPSSASSSPPTTKRRSSRAPSESVLANDYPRWKSSSSTTARPTARPEAVRRHSPTTRACALMRQPNGGKAAALNHGIARGDRRDHRRPRRRHASSRRDTIARLVRHFADPQVGAVAGNVKVGNRINLLTRWQALEYITSQNLDRRAYALLNAITVVPGAVGAWRREALVAGAAAISPTPLAEDMDLTWRIRRDGWKIETEAGAIAYTEAPDTSRLLQAALPLEPSARCNASGSIAGPWAATAGSAGWGCPRSGSSRSPSRSSPRWSTCRSSGAWGWSSTPGRAAG